MNTRHLSVLGLTCTLALFAPHAQAQWLDSTCSSGTFNWSNTNCWSGNTVPTSGGVSLSNSGAGNIQVNLDTDVNAGVVYVYATGTGTMGLNIATNNLLTTGSLEVGVDSGDLNQPATGSITQSGATVTVYQDLVIGVGPFGGIGSYTQTGGTLYADRQFVLIGNGPNAQGSLNLSGGTTVLGTVLMGEAAQGSGTLDISGTANVTIGNVASNALNYSLQGLGYSELDLDGGTLSMGGTITVTTFNVGNALNSNGTFTSSRNTVSAVNMTIGNQGTGTYILNGPTTTLTGGLTLAAMAGSSGTLTLQSGTFQTPTVQTGLGTSTINFDGGSLATGTSALTLTSLNVGNGPGSVGTYSIGSGSSVTAATEMIGGQGTGTLTVNGTNSVTGNGTGILWIGFAPGSSGTYNQTGGTTTAIYQTVGQSGTGAFNLSGGSNVVQENLYLGYTAGTSGTYTQTGGNLSALSESVGSAGSGAFIHSAGTNAVTGTLFIGGDPTNLSPGAGSYALSGSGILTASDEEVGYIGPGSFTQTGGSNTTGILNINNGSYTYSGGTLTINTSLTNSGTFNLVNATLGGSGALVNNGLMIGYGTIGGSGGFTNSGQLTQSGGTLTLANSGSNANNGNIDLAPGLRFNLSGGSLDNTGTVNLNGAFIQGTGTFINDIGGTLEGAGSISAPLNNLGNLAVSGGTLTLTQGLSNNGTIQLASIGSTLSGGAIVNAGTLQGMGNVTNAVTNTGTIEPVGGTLSFVNALTNATSGVITANIASKVLAEAGIASNAGLISLAGGSVSTNGVALSNQGQIVGYGVLATGGLTNNGTMTLAGGTTTVQGSFNNATQLNVTNGAAVFTSPVVNNGTVKATNATLTFAAGYTENGSYISDPSTNNFTNLTISNAGYLVGAAGDVWNISGNFVNNSEQSTQWNTDLSTLVLSGSSNRQQIYLAGLNEGAVASGYNNNFAWGDLSLLTGESAQLLSGANSAASTAALYVGLVQLGGGIAQLSSIDSNYDIYYNSSLTGNAYLDDKTYSLDGSGELIPIAAGSSVPLPAAGWLLLSGLGGLLTVGRPRRQGRPLAAAPSTTATEDPRSATSISH